MDKKSENMFQLIYNKLKTIDSLDNLSEEDCQKVNKIFGKLCKLLKFSEHSLWRVEWEIDKWHSMAEKLSGVAPYATDSFGQNIVLDGGATEILNLMMGAGTPYNNANAKIYVGTDTTAEKADQTGVLATGNNRAIAYMDTGYPVVSGRTITFSGTYGDDSANFAWNEFAVANGAGANAIALNRKVSPRGTKNTGTWTMRVTFTIVSA